jgi:hypothetical protein
VVSRVKLTVLGIVALYVYGGAVWDAIAVNVYGPPTDDVWAEFEYRVTVAVVGAIISALVAFSSSSRTFSTMTRLSLVM